MNGWRPSGLSLEKERVHCFHRKHRSNVDFVMLVIEVVAVTVGGGCYRTNYLYEVMECLADICLKAADTCARCRGRAVLNPPHHLLDQRSTIYPNKEERLFYINMSRCESILHRKFRSTNITSDYFNNRNWIESLCFFRLDVTTSTLTDT